MSRIDVEHLIERLSEDVAPIRPLHPWKLCLYTQAAVAGFLFISAFASGFNLALPEKILACAFAGATLVVIYFVVFSSIPGQDGALRLKVVFSMGTLITLACVHAATVYTSQPNPWGDPGQMALGFYALVLGFVTIFCVVFGFARKLPMQRPAETGLLIGTAAILGGNFISLILTQRTGYVLLFALNALIPLVLLITAKESIDRLLRFYLRMEVRKKSSLFS